MPLAWLGVQCSGWSYAVSVNACFASCDRWERTSLPLVWIGESVPCDPIYAFPVRGSCVAGSLCASLSAEQPGSLPGWKRARTESASVLAVWIVYELCCWSALVVLSSVCGAQGMPGEWCNVSSLGVQC